jgi:hypothetical protein
MITDLFLWIVNPIMEFITGFIPVGVTCPFTGFSFVGSYLGSIYRATADFVPWTEMFMMASILITIMMIRVAMQVVHLIRG